MQGSEGVTEKSCSVRKKRALGRLLLALALLALVLAACDSPTIQSRPTPAPAWRFPTPFPPVQYPTEVAGPGLPPALRRRVTPQAGMPTYGSPVAVQGRVQEELLQIELVTAKPLGVQPRSCVVEHC